MTEEPSPTRPPDHDDRARLEAALREAQDVFRADPRAGAMAALSAVIDVLNTDPAWARANLSLPLWTLLAALHDLDKGQVTPMLAPVPGVRHRAPASAVRQIVRGYAIYTVDCLRSGGQSTETACTAVARILGEQGIAIGGRIDTPDWKVVRGWRAEMSRRNPVTDQDRAVLDGLHGDADLTQVPREDVVEVATNNLRAALEVLGRLALV